MVSWLLVRPRAWWYNKVPLSFTFVLLLADGTRFDAAAIVLLVAVVVAVCGAANYGYAINELFDVVEDGRIGRDNVAARIGTRRMWVAVIVSALVALGAATIVGGVTALLLTCGELCLPLLYSVPPIRIKERKWFGVASDALAAHVYPAVLALIGAQHLGGRHAGSGLIICTLIWSLSAGLRGILSHQLHTAEQDRAGGLRTVVSDFGAPALERAVVWLLVPLETIGFAGAVLFCSTGVVAWVLLGAFAAYELYKAVNGTFRTVAFRREGQPYVPMLEENLYKAWAPLVFALDAARIDGWYLAMVPLYAFLFMPVMRIEWKRLQLAFKTVRS